MQLLEIARHNEKVSRCEVGDLWTDSESEVVEHATTVWQNIETELQLLLCINVINLEVFHRIFYYVHNMPVKPCEGVFNIEAWVLVIPRLSEIYPIYLLK